VSGNGTAEAVPVTGVTGAGTHDDA
jgi:hypothetical protein